MAVLSQIRIGSPVPVTEYASGWMAPFHPDALLAELSGVDTGFASTTYTANLVVYVPFIIRASTVVTMFGWGNGGAVGGNTDVGVYNEAGTVKLGSTGATLNAGVSNLQTVDSADFTLAAGRYWMALGCDSAVQTFDRANPDLRLLDGMGVKQQAAGYSGGLPATATFNTPTVGILPVFGFSTRTAL